MYPAALLKKRRFVGKKLGMVAGLKNGAAGFVMAPVVHGIGCMQLPHNSGDGDVGGLGQQVNAVRKKTVGVKIELRGIDYFG